MEAFLDLTALHELIESKMRTLSSKPQLWWYALKLVNYRLIDWKPGQMKGETIDTFTMSMNLSELSKKAVKDRAKILKQVPVFLPLAKQVEFSLLITYPNMTKIADDSKCEEKLRTLNMKYFEDYTTLLNVFEEFIKETRDIYETLAKQTVTAGRKRVKLG
jgi:hypothetical protein